MAPAREEHPEELPDDFDPERLGECAYWRCGDLFEQRSANHIFCRKACRSRQRKWERSQARLARKVEAKQARAARRTGDT